MDNEIRKKYRIKAKDSFKTKKKLFLFSLAIQTLNSFSDGDFENFTISVDLEKKYSSEYWQQLENYEINNISIKEITKRIEQIENIHTDLFKTIETQYVEKFSLKFPESDFLKLIEITHCHYCQITLEEIETLGENKKLYKKSLRGWTLEIDRLNSNFEYSPENCVMSCYWCNNAKTDEFTENEFLQIGKEIRKIWQTRLK